MVAKNAKKPNLFITTNENGVKNAKKHILISNARRNMGYEMRRKPTFKFQTKTRNRECRSHSGILLQCANSTCTAPHVMKTKDGMKGQTNTF